uniref:Uncharacterized protein n=1 Tax=Rhizophora mucronata TaxID=61149 RepID=A0A2P2PRS2_RHIMU
MFIFTRIMLLLSYLIDHHPKSSNKPYFYIQWHISTYLICNNKRA